MVANGNLIVLLVMKVMPKSLLAVPLLYFNILRCQPALRVEGYQTPLRSISPLLIIQFGEPHNACNRSLGFSLLFSEDLAEAVSSL
jgi:hypothetical protein